MRLAAKIVDSVAVGCGVRRLAPKIGRPDRDLAGAAGEIEHISRLAQA